MKKGVDKDVSLKYKYPCQRMEREMPLVHFTFQPSEIPVDAKDVHGIHYSAGYHSYVNGEYQVLPGPNAYWIWKTHHGLCLREREANGYDDSDFFMTIWNEEKGEPEEVMFATTRGWTYPCLGSAVDATPEVRAKYEVWQQKKREEYRKADRKAKAVAKLALRRQIINVAKTNNVPYVRLLKLRHTGKLESMLALFGSRIRSGFKLSLRKQLIDWLNDVNSKYDVPFSRKQMEYF